MQADQSDPQGRAAAHEQMQRAPDTLLMGQGQYRECLLATLAGVREQQDPTDPTGEAAELPCYCLPPEGSGDPVIQEKDHPTCHDLQEWGQCWLPSTVEVNFAIQFQTAAFWGG